MRNPEAIHLELNQFRIESFQQVVVSRGVTVLGEFKVVIVVAELNAGLVRCFPRLVENIDQLLVVVEGLALLRLKDRVHHVFQAESLGILNALFPSRLHHGQQVVPARRRDPIVAEYFGEFCRRFAIQGVNFDVLVSDFCHLLDCSRNIFFELIAQRI